MEVRANRKMPDPVRLGSAQATTMAQCMGQRREFSENRYDVPRRDARVVMGFYLPTWQRGLVWRRAQQVAFIESAWRGAPLGTYSYNIASLGSPYDNLLIDGQQRMHAIECYLNDDFPVLGWRWSEVTEVDRRVWGMTTIFSSYRVETEDEAYLRSYYNLMNFGGVAHKEHERA